MSRSSGAVHLRMGAGMAMRHTFLLFCSICLSGQSTVDPTWITVPKNFSGDSVEKLSKKLEIKKEDFEKTDAFQKRLENELQPDKLLNIITKTNPFSIKYDADSETISIKIPIYETGIRVLELEKNLGQRMASNAFGVKKKISKIKKDDYILYDSSIDKKDFSISFKMSNEAARQSLKKLGFIFSIKLAPRTSKNKTDYILHYDYLSLFPYHSDATIDNCIELISLSRTIYCHIENIMMFDTTTRKVIWYGTPLDTITPVL